MCSLGELLDEWKDTDKENDRICIVKWMTGHRKIKREFIDNLLEDKGLLRNDVEKLAYVLLEISTLPREEEQEKRFNEWATEVMLKGKICDQLQDKYVYHITTDLRLQRSIDRHRIEFDTITEKESKINIQRPNDLINTIKKLSKYSDPRLKEKRAIWVTWETADFPCRGVIDIYNKITSAKTKKQKKKNNKDLQFYRDTIINALCLDSEEYKKVCIIILCYKLTPNLNICVPTVADARWGFCNFKPKKFTDDCGKSRAAISCNEGVHGKIDLSGLTNLAIIKNK